MEENPNLWNKKQSDLTVGDGVKMTLMTTLAMGAFTIIGTAVAGVVSARLQKNQEAKANLDNTTEQ